MLNLNKALQMDMALPRLLSRSQQLRRNPNENRSLSQSPTTKSQSLLTKKLKLSDAASDVRRFWLSTVLQLLSFSML